VSIISFEQLICTHNDEYKYIYSSPTIGKLETIIGRELYSIFNSSYDLLLNGGYQRGYCIGQINIGIDEKKYVGIVYFEGTFGEKSKRPFIHMHAIIADQDTYIENNLNFIYFIDKFIKYSHIAKSIDSMSPFSLGKIHISIPVNQYLNEEKLQFLNNSILGGKLDLKMILNHTLSTLTNGATGPLMLKASSDIESVDLAGSLLSLLPSNFRAEISVLAGAMSGEPKKVKLIINSAINNYKKMYSSVGIRNFRISDEIVEIIMQLSMSEKLERLSQLHERYLNMYKIYKRDFGYDANIMLLDESLKRKVLEKKREELLDKTLGYLRSNSLNLAVNYYEKMRTLGLLREDDKELRVKCLFAIKKGDSELLENLFRYYGEERILTIVEDLLNRGEITENHLTRNLNSLFPILRGKENYKSRYEILYRKLYNLYVKDREDLMTLYPAFKNGIIRKEDLMNKFFINLNIKRLSEIESSDIKSSVLYKRLFELSELKKSYPEDPVLNDLVKEYIKKIKDITFIKTGLMSHGFSTSPLKIIEIFLGMPKDSIFSLLLKVAESKDLNSFYEDIIDRAFKEVMKEKR
jgi:hypothetical protein